MEVDLLDSSVDHVESVPKESVSSSVWSYFKKTKDSNSSSCNRCGAPIQCQGGSTSGMRKHLKSKLNCVTSASTKGINMNIILLCIVLCAVSQI